MCLITITSGQSVIQQIMKKSMALQNKPKTLIYQKEQARIMLNPMFIKEADATVINYLGGKAVILLYTNKITTHSSLTATANINVQVLEQDVLKATCSMIPQVTTQNIPVLLAPKNHTIKIILRHRSFEYIHELVLRPLIKHITINIINKVVTINNPSNEPNTFAVDYRLYYINDEEIMPLHQTQSTPAEFELSDGQYRVELTKKVQFWDTWIQYGQWTQDIKIETKKPLTLPLIRKPTQITNMTVTTRKSNKLTTKSTITRRENTISTTTTTQIATTQINILNGITRNVQQNPHQDIAIVKFNGGQILLYLGQHHLLIQTQLLDRAYAKVRLWQSQNK